MKPTLVDVPCVLELLLTALLRKGLASASSTPLPQLLNLFPNFTAKLRIKPLRKSAGRYAQL
jgi:hypothetical protein